MQQKIRARAAARRANKRVPSGALPITIALLAIAAAPIAHATAAGEQDPNAATGGAVTTPDKLAREADYKPQIDGRLSDKRSVGGNGIRARGRVTHAGTGNAVVRLKVRRAGSKRWVKVDASRVKPGRKFSLKWSGGRPGRYATKLTVTKYGKSASDNLGTAYVFRRSFASYYGPGFYGGGLACGGRLSPSTVGVAHKTLPCGTKVTFNVGNRTVTTRVIDRGPYVSGRDWDLTAALKRKLGFGSTGTVNTTR